jgi:hypothetical protein
MRAVNTTGIHEGSLTPWGRADFVSYPAQGFAVVSTPSHGGIFVNPERAGLIDAEWRKDSGWYEEDCEALIVAAAYPEHFCRGAEHREQCLDQLRYWYPETFARVYPEQDRQRTGQDTVRDWERDYAARKAARQA